MNTVPIDAVMISYQMEKGSLSWRDLIVIQRLTAALNKPLLVPVPSGINARELQTLWTAGVDGIVMDITGKTPEEFKELRQIIDKLEPPDTNHRDRLTPTIPRMAPEIG